MNLYEQWKKLADQERTQAEYDEFWKAYFEKEKDNYASILENNSRVITGKLSEVAEKYNMDPVTFTGFIDGINTSLEEQVNLDGLTEDSEIKLEINYEKLYFNMLDAKADWLFGLPEWDGILSVEKREEITKEFKRSKIVVKENKVGRNDPCTCGSGKKYKKCCGK